MSRTAMPSAMVGPPTETVLAGQPLRHGGIGGHLDAEYLDARAHRLRRDRAAGEQTAAANRDHQRIQVRRVLQQFQRQRALARHHVDDRRRDARTPVRVRLASVSACAAASASVSPCSTTRGAPGGGARHLGGRREFRHHDRGAAIAEQPRMPRHRLGVVAGRHRDHAALPRSASLSSASRLAAPRSLKAPVDLQVFQLQHHLGAGGARHRVAGSAGVRSTRPAMRSAAAVTSAKLQHSDELDAEDLVGPIAARRRHGDGVAYLLADQRLGERRGDRQAAALMSASCTPTIW